MSLFKSYVNMRENSERYTGTPYTIFNNFPISQKLFKIKVTKKLKRTQRGPEDRVWSTDKVLFPSGR